MKVRGRRGKGCIIQRPSGGYTAQKYSVFRSCVDHVCCPGRLFTSEEQALRVPNPIPVPISVRVHNSVLGSSQHEDMNGYVTKKKFISPGGSVFGASSFTGR